jgi:hypothetical protein
MSPGRKRSVTRTSNAVTPPPLPSGFPSIVPQSGLVWHLNEFFLFFEKQQKSDPAQAAAEEEGRDEVSLPPVEVLWQSL